MTKVQLSWRLSPYTRAFQTAIGGSITAALVPTSNTLEALLCPGIYKGTIGNGL